MAAPLHAENSTTVRSGPSAPLPVRVALAALGKVAPSLAARAGARLFLTPHAGRGRREPLDGGEPFRVRSGREVLRAWRYGHGPAVLLVHGWAGRPEQLARFVEPLRAAGAAPVLFDAPAHGASSGRVTSGLGFAEAVSAVAAAVGARAAIAHSLGGFGLAWALASGLALDAAVLVAPPRGPQEFFQRFCDALQLPPGVRDATRARLARWLGVAVEDVDVARRVGATPLLVIHDRNDREVSWSDGDAIARAWPGAELVSTSGLGHRRILRDGDVTARASAFVVDRLQRCSSGCGRLASEPGAPPVCPDCALERHLHDLPSRWARA
jgi:pimeloyl-ACP methyl ester carboxylesterase